VDDLEVNRRRLGPGASQETIAEVGGAGLKAQARAVANVEGPGRQIAEDVLDNRMEGISTRTMGEAARGLPKAQREMNLPEAEAALRAARSGEATQAYAAAYAAPLNQDVVAVTIKPLMVQGEVLALQSAAKQLDNELLRVRSRIAQANARGGNVNEQQVGAMTAEIDDIMRAQGQLKALAAGQDPGEISTRAIDYYQRGLRQMAEAAGPRTPEGSSYATALDAFNELADNVAPTFGKARTQYGEASRALDMMELGRTILGQTDGQVAMAMRGITGPQKDALVLGVLDSLQQKIDANDTAFVARFVKNKVWSKAVTEALGDKAARRLMTRIRREAAMNAFRNYVLSGSRTAGLSDDIKALTEGESELRFLTEFMEQGGDVKGFVLRRALNWWRRQQENGGIRDPRVNEALARMLYTKATGGKTGGVAQVQAQIRALPQYATGGLPLGTALAPGASRAAVMEQQKRR
jgi:hypothetical protein